MTGMPPTWMQPRIHELAEISSRNSRKSPVYRYPPEWMERLERGVVERMWRRDGTEMPMLRWVNDKSFAKQAQGAFTFGQDQIESVLVEQQQTLLSRFERVQGGVQEIASNVQGLSDSVQQIGSAMTAVQTQLSWLQAAASANLIVGVANLAVSYATLQTLQQLRHDVNLGHARIEGHLVDIKWMQERGFKDVAVRLDRMLEQIERRHRQVALGELAKGIERTARATRLGAERGEELRAARDHLEAADFKLYATAEMAPGVSMAFLRSHEAAALTRLALAENFALQGERVEAARLVDEASTRLQTAGHRALQGASELELPMLELEVSRCCSVELLALAQFRAALTSKELIETPPLPALASTDVPVERSGLDTLRPADVSRGALLQSVGQLAEDEGRSRRDLWAEAEAEHQRRTSEALSRRVGEKGKPTTLAVWSHGDHDFDEFRRVVRGMVASDVRSKFVVKRLFPGDRVDRRDDAAIVVLNLSTGGADLVATNDPMSHIREAGAQPIALTRGVTDVTEQKEIVELYAARMGSDGEALGIPQVDIERPTNIDLAMRPLLAEAA